MMAKKQKGPIYLAVLNFNTTTVNLYHIDEEEQGRISEELDEVDDDAIVLEFMRENEHRESECNYMYSREPISVFAEGEQIYE